MFFRSVLHGFMKIHTLNCKAQATHRYLCGVTLASPANRSHATNWNPSCHGQN